MRFSVVVFVAFETTDLLYVSRWVVNVPRVTDRKLLANATHVLRTTTNADELHQIHLKVVPHHFCNTVFNSFRCTFDKL